MKTLTRILSTLVVTGFVGSRVLAQVQELASLAWNEAQGNEFSANTLQGISTDGRFVVFTSLANNLGQFPDTNGGLDIFLRDREVDYTTRITTLSIGASFGPCMTADGALISFESTSSFVSIDQNSVSDVYVYDSGNVALASVAWNPISAGDAPSYYCGSISADHSYIAFASDASNLLFPGQDTNGLADVFVRAFPMHIGPTERVNIPWNGGQANADSFRPSISGDGRFIVYESDATNLVPNDTNGYRDIFVRDRSLGTTTRVSQSVAGSEGNDYSSAARVTLDGQFVLFASDASNLVPDDVNPFASDLFVADRMQGTLERITGPSGGGGSRTGT